jgi:hypothetical protein
VLQEDGTAIRTPSRAERRVRGGGGAGAHFRALFYHIFATASRAATALLLMHSCARAIICRLRCARSAAAVGTLVRVCCCASPARTTRADQHVSVVTRPLPHDALRMRLPAHSAGPHAWCCRPNLSLRRRRRCVPSRCASGWAVAPRECPWEYQLRANHPPRGRLFAVFFVSENNFRAFPAVKKKSARNDRKSDVRSSRRSSATLLRRRWSRTSRRRTSTPRLPTFC